MVINQHSICGLCASSTSICPIHEQHLLTRLKRNATIVEPVGTIRGSSGCIEKETCKYCKGKGWVNGGMYHNR